MSPDDPRPDAAGDPGGDPVRDGGGDPGGALLLGRMAQEGETPLAVLPLATGPLDGLLGSGSGGGALALSAQRLWLTRPQLVGGASVASLPLADVGAVDVRERRGPLGGGVRVEVVVDGRPLRFSTRAGRAAADAFARALTTARQAPPG
ncbi:hypothetical protein [Kineococcus indalonis]|uniref:hypothetical protein n=1 Tax=Kineococcus indalonis TaxID=2696566 RepID=UPI0014120EB7|nr:hypothetical protein [Kineococcus indalonis]NAZ88502.1 hypothetical protein [Kineococcus indalonis]